MVKLRLYFNAFLIATEVSLQCLSKRGLFADACMNAAVSVFLQFYIEY